MFKLKEVKIPKQFLEGTAGNNHIFKGEVKEADRFSHFTSLSGISETYTDS